MNIISRIRKSYFTKGLALTLALNMLTEMLWPTAAMALTGGPSQPEVQSFEPVESTDMVNLFTGDFTYNIPLINVPGPNGGYPINLSYHGGPTMDQEASWVGLGWNINAGALVRNVRGFADDANGDTLVTKVDMKENVTVGVGVGANIEILGADSDVGKVMEVLNETNPSFGLSLGVRFNNYSGFGVSIGASFNPPIAGDGNTSFGISLDSESGVGVSANYSTSKLGKENVNHGFGLSYSNEGLGFNFSRTKTLASNSSNQFENRENGSTKSYTKRGTSALGLSGSSSIGFSANTHAPSFSYPFTTNHTVFSIKTGPGSLFGVYGSMSFNGYFNIQAIRQSRKGKDYYDKVYGFENLHNAGSKDLRDFTRQKDGEVSYHMSNLATPMLTYDTYSTTGQGISGHFRAFRTDVGRVYDPRLTSAVGGGSVAFDLSPTNHIGFGGTVTFGEEKQRPWDYKNDWKEFEFLPRKEETSGTYDYKDEERVYYRMHGDKSSLDTNEMTFIGGEDVLHPENDNTLLHRKRLRRISVPEGIKKERPSGKRISRNILIHKYSNQEVERLYDNILENRGRPQFKSESDISEMAIIYYKWESNNQNSWDPNSDADFASEPLWVLQRDKRGPDDRNIGHHNAGYKVLNDQGQYYVYGLPSYNLTETASIFSVDSVDGSTTPTIDIDTTGGDGDVNYKAKGTDKFIDKRTKSPYAHSYMLTSILGADYVDVSGDGATDDDLGYWVRFDYLHYTSEDAYEWRAPYHGANYDRGSLAHTDDDKGSYMYGQKELWYLTKIETKTHVLTFTLSERKDNLEAAGEFANSGTGSQSGLKVDKMSLYLKDEYRNESNPIPLQEVHFEYDYSLCQGVPNNNNSQQLDDNETANQGGKLTLKKVWFTYEGSTKGAMSPYQFDYDASTNYNYNQFAYDRWGNYKQDGTDSTDNEFRNRFLPYVEQFDPTNADSTAAHQQLKDDIAGAWSLSSIHLPSGGKIDMTYEADDYAFVQNEVATQMFNIAAVNDSTNSDNMLFGITDIGVDLDSAFNDPEERRIYFDLELPIATSINNDDTYASLIYDQYVKGLVLDEEGNRNLYFKNYTKLRDGIWDYVSGYIPIEESSNHKIGSTYLYGIDAGSALNGSYRKGFITIQKQPKKVKYKKNANDITVKKYHTKYHPMAIAAWQHMRLNEPLMLTAPLGVDLESAADGTDQNKADAAAGLLGFIPSTIQMFTGIYKYCRLAHFANEIDLEKSVIRLCTPDMKKYGGGHRIKQIEMTDNWSSFSGEASASYGVEYEYTKTLEDGTEISSGVAQYEPMLGGDEIALRYPKAYVNKVPFKTNVSTYFEHPVNEFYYPAPTVGYSAVTVKSINTGNQIREAEDNGNDSGIGTTGLTVYEFYTAKDFPVIVEETEIDKSKLNLHIPIPFIGKFVRKKVTAIQGYKIELNDMHGQLKSIKKYGLNDDYSINLNETSSVEYIYQHDVVEDASNDRYYLKLDNKVKTVGPADDGGIPSTEERLVGVEYDFFTDQRQNKSYTVVAGVYANMDLIPAGVPLLIPGVWPQFSSVKKNVKTMSTNKVIFKSGILAEVRTFDGKASVTTKNEVFDEESGRPIIVSVNNEFNDRIYNYSHPAHWEYDRMGHAYENIELEFETKITTDGTLDGHYKMETDDDVINKLVSGDMLLFKYLSSGEPKGFIATYLGASSDTEGIIHVETVGQSKADGISGSIVDCEVIRSGRRNHVFADAGNLVTKQFPVKDGAYTPDGYYHDEIFTETVGVESVSDTLRIHAINKVINATAVQYRDEWAVRDGVENPFAVGEAGIWRPFRSYVYVGNRTNGANADNPDIRDAGVMDSVDLFNWQVMDYETYSPDWEWTSEITRYNAEAYEVENVDRLGINSAALYSNKGSLVQAVGANAGYHEIGFEDFEDFTDSSTVTFGSMSHETNLNFYNSTTIDANEDSCGIVRNYRINQGISLADGEFMLELATTYNFSGNVELVVQTSEFAGPTTSLRPMSKSYRIPCSVVSSTQNGSNVELKVKSKIQFSSDYYTFVNEHRIVRGRVSVSSKEGRNLVETLEGNVRFISHKAHTGDRSMELDQNQTYTFSQGNLDLKNQTYVLSAWVSQTSEKRIDYDSIDINPVQYDTSTSQWQGIQVMGTKARSKVVEGWQKIEVEFIPTAGKLFGIEITSLGEKVYIDDIRISPKTGGIVTYVYDKENFRLRAMLDDNNYATLYFYDEEGNLHLVKRETERGIQTISENRGYNKETASN